MYQALNLGRFSVVLACCAVAFAAPAFAQSAPGALFGATRADAGGGDRLNLQMVMAAALDSEVPAEVRSLDPRNDLSFGGRSSVVAASADYARVRRRVQLYGAASTFFRYIHRLDRIGAGTQSAHLGAGIRLPKQGSLEITQAAGYSPSYLYQLFPMATPLGPGEPIPVNPEYRIDQTESYFYQTRTTLGFGSVRATRWTTTAEYNLTDFKKSIAPQPNLFTYGASTKISRALSRRARISAGYGYRTGEFYGTGEFDLRRITKEHQVTLGVEYSPALSVTRRATFRLQVSPTLFQIPESALTTITTAAVDKRLYPLQGEASIDYPFRLKWQAVVSYRRSVEYFAVLSEPVFAEGARVKVTGVIGRRVDVSALGGYANAVSTLSRKNKNLSTYTAEARIKYAFTRSFALYSEYLYYYYDQGEQAHLAAGLPAVYEQHGIRVGFMLFGQPLGRQKTKDR